MKTTAIHFLSFGFVGAVISMFTQGRRRGDDPSCCEDHAVADESATMDTRPRMRPRTMGYGEASAQTPDGRMPYMRQALCREGGGGMTREEHKARHAELHNALDELVAD